jgi:large subunit ribosomal protein L15
MFSLNNLPRTVQKKSKRIGRGGNRGKNAGQGNKGQQKRAGATRIGFEGGQKTILKRTPKVKGYGFNPLSDRNQKVLTLSSIEKNFSEGDTLSIKTLLEKKMIDEKIKNVRIINTGSLTKKIKIEKSDNLYLTKSLVNVFN